MTFSFGTPAAKPASSGFSFGNTANNSTTTPTRQSSFNFGASSTAAGNTAINSGSASGFSFGSSTPAKTTTTTTTGSSGGFSFGKTDANANKPATSTGGFSFGNTSSTTNTTAKPATTGGFSFGGSSTTTNKTGTSTGFSFGNFGKTSTTGTSSFSFGNTTSNNNQNQQQNAELKNVLTPEDYKDQLAMALTCPQLYGDERDGIVAKWNQLQAAWGSGIAYRHNNQEPIKLTEKNMYCRFKAIGYTRMPSNRDKDGLVHLQVAKSAETVRGAQKDFVGFLQSLLGNQVNLVIKVDSINDLPDNKCEIVIYIQEQMKISNENIGSFDMEASTSTSSSFRVPTSIVYANLKQHAEKLKNAGITGIKNRVAMTEEQINEYLDNAPPGISEIQWNNAKKFNPDPKILLPVPLHGFDSLSRQHNHQRLLTEQQLVMISQIKEKMQNLQENNNERVAKLEKYKDKANLLKRKVLRLIARQELARNQSMNVNNYNNNFGGTATNPLSKDEEVLLGGLEHVNKQWSNKIKAADRLYDIKTMLKNMGQEVNLNIDNKFEKSGDNIFNDTLDMDTSHVSNFDEGEEKNLISASQEKFMDKDLEEYMTKMLSKHQVQLDCMSSLIEGDMRDLAILVEDMKAN